MLNNSKIHHKACLHVMQGVGYTNYGSKNLVKIIACTCIYNDLHICCGLPYVPSTRMKTGVLSVLTSHFTVEPLLASCRLEMVMLTGLSVRSPAEELSPGVPRKVNAGASSTLIVLLTMSTTQKITSSELPLCLQVKVMSPPAGMAYPPEVWVPSATKVATTRSVCRK